MAPLRKSNPRESRKRLSTILFHLAALAPCLLASLPAFGGAPIPNPTPLEPQDPALAMAGGPTFSLGAQYFDRPSAGFEVVQPITRVGTALIVGEVYGFKGDMDLGGLGAGAILWQPAFGGFLEGNVFFDALQDSRGFSYPQLGAGVGFDRGWYALRANGYLPLTGSEKSRTSSDRWKRTSGSLAEGRVETTHLGRDTFETSSPMRGFEMEAEFGLPKPPRDIDPRVVVGYYHQSAEHSPKVYSGLKVRGEVRIAQHWTAEVEWRSDSGDIDQEWRFAVRGEWTLGGNRKPTMQDSDGVFEARMLLRANRQPWPTVARHSTKGRSYTSGRSVKLAPVLRFNEPGCECGEPLVFE